MKYDEQYPDDPILPADPMQDVDIQAFEASAQSDGELYWSARAFSEFLGYADYKSFSRPLQRAISACLNLEISVEDNFRDSTIEVNGQTLPDKRLSRFACYLVAMNSDPRKRVVAKAQAYLAGLAENFREYVEAIEDVDRIVIRGDLSQEERSLSATAHRHGVGNYAFFQNAGYRGMYNMDLKRLRALKSVPQGRSPLDFMYSEELAANLFRITQTNAKIRNDQLRGQSNLESAAHEVGRTVRKTMIEISGTPPEQLPAADDIKIARRRLRSTSKDLKKLDKGKS